MGCLVQNALMAPFRDTIKQFLIDEMTKQKVTTGIAGVKKTLSPRGLRLSLYTTMFLSFGIHAFCLPVNFRIRFQDKFLANIPFHGQ